MLAHLHLKATFINLSTTGLAALSNSRANFFGKFARGPHYLEKTFEGRIKNKSSNQ